MSYAWQDPTAIRDKHYLMTDKELADAVDRTRLRITFKQPIQGDDVRCLEEVSRRLRALRRVTEHSNAED